MSILHDKSGVSSTEHIRLQSSEYIKCNNIERVFFNLLFWKRSINQFHQTIHTEFRMQIIMFFFAELVVSFRIFFKFRRNAVFSPIFVYFGCHNFKFSLSLSISSHKIPNDKYYRHHQYLEKVSLKNQYTQKTILI